MLLHSWWFPDMFWNLWEKEEIGRRERAIWVGFLLCSFMAVYLRIHNFCLLIFMLAWSKTLPIIYDFLRYLALQYKVSRISFFYEFPYYLAIGKIPISRGYCMSSPISGSTRHGWHLKAFLFSQTCLRSFFTGEVMEYLWRILFLRNKLSSIRKARKYEWSKIILDIYLQNNGCIHV